MKHGRADETLEWLGLGSLQDSYDKAVAGAEADTIRGARKAGLRQGLWSIFSLPRPRWPIFLITRNERPYKGWWGSRTSTTSGNDSSNSLLGTFLNPLAVWDRLAKSSRNFASNASWIAFCN